MSSFLWWCTCHLTSGGNMMVVGCYFFLFLSLTTKITRKPLWNIVFSTQSLLSLWLFCLILISNIKNLICFNFIFQLKLSMYLNFILVPILLILGLLLNPLFFCYGNLFFYFIFVLLLKLIIYYFLFYFDLYYFNFLFDLSSFNFFDPSKIILIS